MSQPTKNLAAILPAAKASLVVEERPTPTPGPSEILVRNHFIGLNHIDYKRQFTGIFISSFPTILGIGMRTNQRSKIVAFPEDWAKLTLIDLSGIVETVGSNVTKFKPGDRIFGAGDAIVSQKPDNASFQTYTIVRESSASKLPSNISLEEAATLPTCVVTSYLMLFHVLGLPKPGAGIPPQNTVLIWGGGSILGGLAIQYAHIAGLHVYAVASARHEEYLCSIGANAVFDYNSATVVQDVVNATESEGKPIAYVVDAVSSPSTLGSILDILSKSTANAKKIVHSTRWPEDLVKPDDVGAEMVHGGASWTDMVGLGSKLLHEDLPKWLESGAIKPPPYRVIEGGVAKIQTGLNELQAGVSNLKLVVKV